MPSSAAAHRSAVLHLLRDELGLQVSGWITERGPDSLYAAYFISPQGYPMQAACSIDQVSGRSALIRIRTAPGSIRCSQQWTLFSDVLMIPYAGTRSVRLDRSHVTQSVDRLVFVSHWIQGPVSATTQLSAPAVIQVKIEGRDDWTTLAPGEVARLRRAKDAPVWRIVEEPPAGGS